MEPSEAQQSDTPVAQTNFIDSLDPTVPWPDRAIIEFTTTSATLKEIANRYGRDQTTVWKAFKRLSVMKPNHLRRRTRVRFEDQTPLSPVHRRVGILLNEFRTIKHDLTYSELGDMILVNRQVVSQMEKGIHDFKLTELQRIANLIGVTGPEFFNIPVAWGKS